MDQQWHSIFDNSMRQPWLYFCYLFDASFVNSVTLSIPYVGCHSLFIDDFKVYSYFVFVGNLWINCDIAFFRIPWVSHDSFLLLIWCVSCESIDAVASVHQLSLSFQWWFQGLHWLYYRWLFMDHPWHNVFDNSMHQPSLYFCYWLYASVMNSVTVSIPYVTYHSVFIDDFKFNRDNVFADDLWIRSDIAFLTIPCVNHDSIFSIDLMHHSWIQWRCWFQTSAVTQYSLTISRSTITLFSLTIYRSAAT
jgi:hypothetical protein